MIQSDAITKWCSDIILGSGGLHDFEDHEMATPLVDRDVAIAMWVVRALGDSTSAETQAVVDAIVARRDGSGVKRGNSAA